MSNYLQVDKIASETKNTNGFVRFPKYSVIIAAVLTALYLFFNIQFVGLRGDQVFLLLVTLIGYFLHPLTRRLVIAFSVFIAYTVVYDSMKAFPNYLFNTVHIQDLYEYEKALFGITSKSGLVLTPNEYLNRHTSPLLDLVSGFFYLTWIPVPLMLALYLWIKDKMLLLHFSYAFLLTNVIGFSIYYLYPAAPPWYVELYGFTKSFEIPSNVAGLIRFDHLIGMDLFQSMYTAGSNVFAAVPSMHSAYPVVALAYGIKKRMGWVNILLLIVVLGIWFAAVYTSHHYILDVIAGALCAGIAILIFETAVLKSAWVNKQFERLARSL